MLPTVHDRLQSAGSAPEAGADAGQPADAPQGVGSKPFDREFVSLTGAAWRCAASPARPAAWHAWSRPRTAACLPAVVRQVPGASACPRCGAPTVAAWGCESAEVLAIEVKAYRRPTPAVDIPPIDA